MIILPILTKIRTWRCVYVCGTVSLWEFVACAALLSLIVPFCGIPAVVFAVRSQAFYRQGDMTASRAANLTALRLITAGGVCVCVAAIAASVLIAVFSHDTRPPTHSIPTAAARSAFAGTAARQRPRGALSSNAFEKALQRHAQEALTKQPGTINSRSRQSGGFGSLFRESGRRAQFSDRRSAVRTTLRPKSESGFMRRLRTWNRST